ncbi:NERD domain-containing protein [Mesorhizobium sp. M0684]|uniref:nuclease-related domain-containing DEAD/DEAH box helicase n=1 Tax=unclassified Mesorhizobium TaxID=325217 RepID=UPI003337A2E2
MTRMYPSRLPAKANRGEAEIFALIRDAAGSDDYACLHSVGLVRHNEKEYAEADFVVVGPAGIFCIEVKGGNVVRSDGFWTIGPEGSTYTSIESPFAQAEKTTHPLRKHLEAELGLKRNNFLLGWGTAFPHITFRMRSPEWDSDVVYDERDKDFSFIRYLERLERHFRDRRMSLGRAAPPRLTLALVTQIVTVLRGDFELVPTVRGLIGDSRRELASLSAAQFGVLDYALNDRNPRIICDGAAGTGKTLIAAEAARRLTASGKKILFLCFNNQLGRFLAADALDAGEPVRISTVHGFMSDLIRKGGFEQQLRSSRAAADRYTRIFPDLFEKAAYALLEENELPQYDAIVVDEAQDVLDGAIMNCLDLVLAGGFRTGSWLIFLDTGPQSDVYGRMDDGVLATLRASSPAEFILRENYRNPRAVVTELCEVTGSEPPVCRRMLQSTVDYRLFSDEREQGRKLKALLVELLRDGVPPTGITILSAKGSSEACVTRHPPDVGKMICRLENEADPCPNEAISAASISAFKGLENEVIILTDVPPLDPISDWTRAILYVGMTRARSKLYMLVDQAYLDARTRC